MNRKQPGRREKEQQSVQKREEGVKNMEVCHNMEFEKPVFCTLEA